MIDQFNNSIKERDKEKESKHDKELLETYREVNELSDSIIRDLYKELDKIKKENEAIIKENSKLKVINKGLKERLDTYNLFK